MSRKRSRNNNGTNGTVNRYKKGPSSYDNCPTAARKRNFLTARQLGVSISEAARLAQIPRTTLYRWRDHDPEFAQAWTESRDTLVDELEMDAYHRAREGDRHLLMFLLKSYRPETFNQRQHQRKPSTSRAAGILELAEKVREWV